MGEKYKNRVPIYKRWGQMMWEVINPQGLDQGFAPNPGSKLGDGFFGLSNGGKSQEVTKA